MYVFVYGGIESCDYILYVGLESCPCQSNIGGVLDLNWKFSARNEPRKDLRISDNDGSNQERTWEND